MTTSVHRGVRAVAGETPPRAYRFMGRVLLADFPFRDLAAAPEPVDESLVALRLLASDEAFPEPGALLRELLHPSGEGWHLRVHAGPDGMQWLARGIGRFWVEPSGRVARYRLEPGATFADAEQPLLGPVLGIAMQLQGETLLHAGAVAVGSRAIAFTGPSDTGKSTLAAAFARAGDPLFGDDVLPLRTEGGHLLAVPYAPRLKLWNDSVEGLGERPERLDRILSGFEKRRVPADAGWGTIAEDPLELAAIYLLRPSGDPEQPIVIEAVEPFPAAMQLVSAMYMAELHTRERAAASLAAAVALTERVPVRVVSYPRTFAVFERLRAALHADAAPLAAGEAG